MTKYWGKETLALQLDSDIKVGADESESESESESDSESEGENGNQDDEEEVTKKLVQKAQQHLSQSKKNKKAHVYPNPTDYGENDDKVVGREEDINEKSDKKSGWTNPLSWKDDGTDDEKVLPKRKQQQKL